ncbi:unnamed protein product [Linum tenue]|uniref:F-box domain-containing protein n=1 Tax=Linum tenue TaxID=586396 RepID=A0AAV0M635_9ROSI|nr:unnamed protein product [Linum tenue]
MDGGNSTGVAAVGRGTSFLDLPEGCIFHILSFTSPIDVCKFSMVSPSFRSLASSDDLWERFLPSDYRSILQSSAEPPSFYTKKGLFRTLCTRPIVFDDCRKSICLDRKSGNKCYMLAARDLSIESSGSPHHWAWIKHNGSRFPEVAELKSVPALVIRGEITASMLSPATTYVACLVYELKSNVSGCLLVDISVSIARTAILAPTICLKPNVGSHNHHENGSEMLGVRRPKSRRSDGWLEVELYSHEGSKNCGSEAISIQVKGGQTQGGIIIQGIEIRPMNSEIVEPAKPNDVPEGSMVNDRKSLLKMKGG